MKLLDLFCGAGGAAMGYHRAGFDVVGVDIHPQRNFPFPLIEGDAMNWARNMTFLDMFDVVHASPPCQRYSSMSKSRPGLADNYPDLVDPIRDALEAWGGPYVIENVPGSPLRNPLTLCGRMFGLDLYRHRLFESSLPLTAPTHPEHTLPASRAGHWVEGTIMSVAGHIAPMWKAREVMGIDWMNRDALAEAIPPAYTEWLGRQLVDALVPA